MPVIGAKVSAETKARFDSMAVARKTTSSRLAAQLIADFMNRDLDRSEPGSHFTLRPSTAPVERQFEAKSEQVYVRLEPFYFAELGRLAAERLWHRGTYLGNLFRAHLDRRPVLCDTEINAVRQVARQLAAIGRNVNQIARKANSSPQHAHLVSTIDFDLIRMLIELESMAVRDLMRANIRGWGVSDVEA
jgi:hypothetical protein